MQESDLAQKKIIYFLIASKKDAETAKAALFDQDAGQNVVTVPSVAALRGQLAAYKDQNVLIHTINFVVPGAGASTN